MLRLEDVLALRKALPFVPFRFVLDDGRTVEVNYPQHILPGRQLAVIGLPDPSAADTLIDGWMTVWYMQVSRVEYLTPLRRG